MGIPCRRPIHFTKDSQMTTLRFVREHFRFLAFGFLLTFVCNFGQTFFIGFYNDPIRAAFNLSNGDFGALYGLATLCSAGTLIWVGRLIDTVDLRYYTLATIILMVFACLLMSVDGGIGLIGISLYLLRLTGQGLMPHISNTSMGRYFESARGRAISISNLGINLGQIALPAAAVFLLARMEWRDSWMYYAGFLVVFVMPLALAMLKGHGERHRKWEAEMTVAESQSTSHSRMKYAANTSILKDMRFYIVMPGFLAVPIFATGIFFFQGALLDAKGWNAEIFATAFAIFGITTTLSALAGGWLVDKIGGSLKLLPFINTPFALAVLGLAYGDHTFWLPAMMALMGISNGLTVIIAGALWPEMYGTKKLGAIRSVTTSIMIFGTAVAPAALGYLYDAGVTIAAAFTSFALYIALVTAVQIPFVFKVRAAGAV
jgi:MFS family permease